MTSSSRSDPPLLSSTTQHILRVLLDAEEPMWALQITKKAGVRFGTGYATLTRLVEHHWVDTTLETAGTHPGRPARLFYQLTTTGRAQAEAALQGRDTAADS